MKQYLIIIPVAAILLLMILVFGHEIWVLGIIKDQAVIDSYHFGTESMVSHGGKKYRSLNSYLASAMLLWLFATTTMALLVVWIWRGKMRMAAIGSVVMFVIFVFGFFNGISLR